MKKLRTAEEILSESKNAEGNCLLHYISTDGYVYKMIESSVKQAQKETIEFVLEYAAERVEMKRHLDNITPLVQYPIPQFYIDKLSITGLKEELLKQIG